MPQEIIMIKNFYIILFLILFFYPVSFADAGNNLNQREAKILDGLDKTGREILSLNIKVKALKKDIIEKEKNILTLEKNLKLLKAAVNKKQKRGAERLAAYYKSGSTGFLPLLFGADSFYDLIVRENRLKKVINADKKIWLSLNNSGKKIKNELLLLRRQRKRLTELHSIRNLEVSALKKKRAGKKELLALVHKEKALLTAAVKNMHKASISLGLITGLKEKTKSRKKRKITVTRKAKSALSGFPAFMGRLPNPVKNGIIQDSLSGKKQNSLFGMYKNGIRIKAMAGTPIMAVYDGKIAYAGWFRGYGNMMILDHGDSYFTILAHAEDLFKKKGEKVNAGDIIATVGESGSLTGPGLYFEIRHHSMPLDPLKWLKME